MKDAPRLRVLLDDWQIMLAKHAAGPGSIEIIELLLAGHEDNQKIRQLMLESAAKYGNVDVLQYLLQAYPSIEISDDVRSAALEGGVEVWKALLTHSPGLIERDFGEKGDLISMTALMNNVSLTAALHDSPHSPYAKKNSNRFLTIRVSVCSRAWRRMSACLEKRLPTLLLVSCLNVGRCAGKGFCQARLKGSSKVFGDLP